MSNYRELETWRQAHALALLIYRFAATLPSSEMFGLASQMRRAATSIPMNLAEGSGRSTDRNFARFVAISIGSASELDHSLLLVGDLGLGDSQLAAEARIRTSEVRKMLYSLRKHLNGGARRT
jgi:four helix bundle protein